MTYREALEYLAGRQRFGMRPGLDGMRRLAAAVGSPEQDLRFVHVAGTNGKGSTCAFLESIARASGRRVGLYTSPHLVSFRERIQVDRQPIPEAAVAAWVESLREVVEEVGGEEEPTFFEFVTLLALCWFREQRCELVVWETGLGGRLDATNIVVPVASVITNIGWDHMQWLGNTRGAIAAEKAGILKPGVRAFTATDDPEAWGVIEAEAARVGAPLRRVVPEGRETAWVRGVGLPLAGEHQIANAALAVATAQGLNRELRISDEVLSCGLRNARWPGRFQVVEEAGRTLVLDGAHNRPAFEALGRTLAEVFSGRGFAVVLGMLGDKDPRAAAELLVARAERTVVVPVHSNRGGDPEEQVRICRELGGGRPVESAPGLGEALDRLRGHGVVVITGSLYLVGEALAAIDGETYSERGLNDWGPTR
jgi:dihydrofolate synthase/folylpolyglutamate synthase